MSPVPQRRTLAAVAAAVVAAVALAAPAAAQYGPDPSGAPADFMCAWRNITMQYAAKVRPDASALVYDALELGSYCNGAIPRPDEATLPKVFPPPTHSTIGAPASASSMTYYVDCGSGSDSHSGSKSSPFKTIQRGVDAARSARAAEKSKDASTDASSVSSATVLVRAGTCYMAQPVTIGADDSFLTIANEPGEMVWLSGGVLLENLSWTRVTTPTFNGSNSRVWQADLSAYKLSDVASMRVNGRRHNPARYPNADPETQFWPVGYLTSRNAFVPQGDWLKPTIPPSPNTAQIVNLSTPNRDFDAQFQTYRGGIGGTCAIYDPPFSFWCQSAPFSAGCGGCFTWNIPSGVEATALTKRPNFPYTNPSDVQFLGWRKAHWANWAFEVDSIADKGTIVFGKGGFQGARGGPGSDWFVQNVMEELDQPNEFYFDKTTQTLYYYSNATDPTMPPASKEEFIAIPAAQFMLINANATMQAPIKNLTLSGLGFRDTAWTMLQPHGVPSGGDWALERLGVAFFEGTENLRVTHCNWTRVGGNAVMLSAYNQHATLDMNEFAWLGGSAIAAWGFTDEISDNGIHGVDGTDGNFPRYTLVESNLFREIGVWEKQSSAFFSGKAAQSTLRHNVVFNLARAGFNFNDGFGGGDVVEENVLFNTCRESSDHGPINSWDRQPFLTNVRTGKPSMQMAWRQVRNNIVIANYGGSKEVDNDDGSLFWNITSNFMAYGWSQKFKCGGIRSSNNFKAYVDLGGKFDAGCLLDDASVYAPNDWHFDTIIHLGTSAFQYRQCWGTVNGVDYDRTAVGNNTIYVENTKVAVSIAKGSASGCPKKSLDLGEFQKETGGDPGTKVFQSYPSTSFVTDLAQQVLGPYDGSSRETYRDGVWDM